MTQNIKYWSSNYWYYFSIICLSDSLFKFIITPVLLADMTLLNQQKDILAVASSEIYCGKNNREYLL